MPHISVSTTLSNGTANDAGPVNTNFSEIIAGLSDGTKDITAAAGTFTSVAATTAVIPTLNTLPISFYQSTNVAISSVATMALSGSGDWELVTSADTLTLTVYDASKPVFVSAFQTKSAVRTDETALTWVTSGTIAFGVAVDLVGAIAAGTVVSGRTSFPSGSTTRSYFNVITGLTAASHTFRLCGLVPLSSSNTIEGLVFMVWQ